MCGKASYRYTKSFYEHNHAKKRNLLIFSWQIFSKYIILYKKPAWLKPASSSRFDNFKFDLQFAQKVDPVWANAVGVVNHYY
jgi:hypothetical protein